MAKQEYWYDATTTKTALKALDTNYKNVMTAALKIGTILKQYVNVKNKWNDENARTFADWWNQNKGAGAGGELKYDKAEKKLYMSSQTNSQTDGEDKIRHVVSMCASIYWLVTCKGLAALSSSYSKEMKKYATYVKLASNSTYTTRFAKSNFTGTTWMTMMSNNFGAKKWVTTKLPIKVANNTSSAVEGKKLADTLSKALTDLNSKVDSFCEEVNRIVGNTNSNKYWGFSTDVKIEVTKAVSKLDAKTRDWLKKFANSTTTALKASFEETKADLSKLAEINFS